MFVKDLKTIYLCGSATRIFFSQQCLVGDSRRNLGESIAKGSRKHKPVCKLKGRTCYVGGGKLSTLAVREASGLGRREQKTEADAVSNKFGKE